jgi:serine/threonine protein kinase
VENLFVAAAELPVEERRQFVESSCGGDAELLEEVLSLLRYDTRAPGLEDEISLLAQSVLTGEPLVGARLGPWLVERELGKGGMSEVYLATRADGRFAKTVAIKVIRRGMDTKTVVERFHAERRILAALDHPYIARLLDGGETPEGLPYLVMDYVEGLPIDRWCQERGASVAERCELAAKVCDAVGYAHRNLVIHRDLKPGNILVGADGTPRLLDFGIAKLLDGGAEPEVGGGAVPAGQESSAGGPMTLGPMRPFTPEYASPEQIAGAPVGTATDVYSLGAVLYELLTGERAAAGWEGRALLRGDLECILKMALRPEPERRYLSVDAFALDIRRYLGGLPVAARPDSLRYRVARFAGRNRLGVAAAAAIVLALAGGVVVSRWEAERARLAQQAALRESARAKNESALAKTERDRALVAEGAADAQRNAAIAERERANTEAAKAKAVTDFLRNDLLGQANPSAGADLKVRTVLDRAAGKIEGKFTGKPLVEADIRFTIGETYEALGLYPDAQKQYRQAWELRRGPLGEKNRETLDALESVGVLYRKMGKLDEAEQIYHRVLAVQRAEFGEKDPATLLTMSSLAVVYSHQGKLKESMELDEKILPLQKQALGPEHIDTLRTMNNLGVDYSRLGRYAEAERIYRDVLAIRQRVQGPEHPNTIFTSNQLAVVYSRPGGDPEAAEKLYRETLDRQRKLLGPDHPDTLLTLDNLGLLLTHIPGRYAAAEQMLKESAEARGRVLGPSHVDTLATRVALGGVEISEAKYTEAETDLRATCDAFDKAGLQVWQRYFCVELLGASLVAEKRLDDAEPLLLAAYRGLKEREASIPAASKQVISRTAEWLTRLYREKGDTEMTEKWKGISVMP